VRGGGGAAAAWGGGRANFETCVLSQDQAGVSPSPASCRPPPSHHRPLTPPPHVHPPSRQKGDTNFTTSCQKKAKIHQGSVNHVSGSRFTRTCLSPQPELLVFSEARVCACPCVCVCVYVCPGVCVCMCLGLCSC
jgi:hypothetical protein